MGAGHKSNGHFPCFSGGQQPHKSPFLKIDFGKN
jgi:hypothetical protein